MKLHNFLKAMDWSQTELAEKLGTSMPNVNKWVKGSGVPSYEFCKKLLELGMSVEDLFDIENYEPVKVKSEYTKDDFMARFKEAMKQWQKEHPGGINRSSTADEFPPDKYQ